MAKPKKAFTRGPVSRNEVDLAKEQGKVKIAGIEAFVASFRMVIVAGIILGLGYFLFKCADVLAGKTTSAAFKAVLHVGADRYVFLAISAVMGGLYSKEKRLRKRVEHRMSERIRELEKRLDDRRSSSAPPKASAKRLKQGGQDG